jgi:glucose-1-phosphate cytidylyltransferase
VKEPRSTIGSALAILEPVVILCGGRGTRLREETESIPKALVEIGGQPIVWHVISIYAHQGYRRFLLLTGYRGELIERWATGTAWPEAIEVGCLGTGLDTPTGGRVKLAQERIGDNPFSLTYADGVADIDLGALAGFHREGGALATMTVVRPELQFGIADVGDDGLVSGFHEKPRAENWINGGFFCLEPALFRYLEEDSVLEREPLKRLAADRELRAYRHRGFWECMDTYKDAVMLNDLWEAGAPPWRGWAEEPV